MMTAKPQPEPEVPDDCLRWCQAQEYDPVVADDLAPVDLDWWNAKLAEHQTPVRLSARDDDGGVVERGRAFLRRDDIADEAGTFGVAAEPDLAMLYRAAAWLMGHRDRSYPKRFPEVRASRPAMSGRQPGPFEPICSALQTYRNVWGVLRSGLWTPTPGVGPQLLSVFCWAVWAGDGDRPQLLDQFGVSMLCYLGWTEPPVAANYTANRYQRYCKLLHSWADEIGVSAELVEMWLVEKWCERIGRTQQRYAVG